ncbi:MAG TPA: chromate resistance protein ChrB domain-containing protein, partial [Candidatus Limnocylindria bacterium]|nr:chromate resistance protein ChrB domain-containing protein [Candidatus Limnocylindria bacterium]
MIRRFIDREAAFTFVADASTLPADAIPFDIAGHPFSHHDGMSTFEVMVQHHGLAGPALASLGRIVHEADIEDECYDAPEAAGLDAVVRGMGMLMDDHALLEATAVIYDGLMA